MFKCIWDYFLFLVISFINLGRRTLININWFYQNKYIYGNYFLQNKSNDKQFKNMLVIFQLHSEKDIIHCYINVYIWNSYSVLKRQIFFFIPPNIHWFLETHFNAHFCRRYWWKYIHTVTYMYFKLQIM